MHSPIINIKNVNPIEKFDIETFNKNQQNDSYEFNLRDSHVLQFSYGDGYAEEITYTDKLFELTKDFYKNGNIKQRGLTFIKGGFMKGVWQFFEPSGNLHMKLITIAGINLPGKICSVFCVKIMLISSRTS